MSAASLDGHGGRAARHGQRATGAPTFDRAARRADGDTIYSAVTTPVVPVAASEARFPRHGPAIGAAACEAENAFRCLACMSLHLDAADLEVTDEVAATIEDVADIAAGLTKLADGIGDAVVEQKAAQ